MFCRRLREYVHFLRSLVKTNKRLIWGMWKLTKLPHPAVTVFGGSRIEASSIHAQQARELGKLLAANGFSVITGGGPGIMEAANAGAIDFFNECSVPGKKCPNKYVSAGIGLLHLNADKANPYVQEYLVMQHFFARKWLLVMYATGFIIFPGGYGTLDELFEIITLVQCNKMQKAPIVLIDKTYWNGLIEWIKETVIGLGQIRPEQLYIITVVDTPQEAFDVIKQFCNSCNTIKMQDNLE